eukprot:scaffold21084_cov60-Phaeocystis_antarctica.AAC.1
MLPLDGWGGGERGVGERGVGAVACGEHKQRVCARRVIARHAVCGCAAAPRVRSRAHRATPG